MSGMSKMSDVQKLRGLLSEPVVEKEMNEVLVIVRKIDECQLTIIIALDMTAEMIVVKAEE